MNVAMVNPKKSSRKGKGKGKLTPARAKALAKAWKARGLPVPEKIKRAGGRSENPRRKRKNYGTPTGAKKAWSKRKRRYGVSGRREAENPRRRKRRSKKADNPWVGPYSYRRKPTRGKRITVKKHWRKPKAKRTKRRRANYGTSAGARKGWKSRRKSSNPRVKGYSYMRKGKRVRVPGYLRGKAKRRRNPEYPTVGGFFPTFARIKSQFSYVMPKRNMLYPTFAEIKAHPILTLIGLPTGFISSSLWGGFGRLIGGKNVLVSEILGVAGNIIGFELPARFISMFNFKGNDVMAKSIRAGGIVATVISALLGIFRIGMSLKKNGIGATLIPKKKNWGVGQITMPKLKEIPAKILKTVGIGALSVNNPISDIVTSGKKQGYTEFQPMGVSDQFLSDEFMSDNKDMPDFAEKKPFWEDATLGDPTLVEKIKALARDMNLGESELFRIAKDMKGDFHYDEQELEGIGQISVPPAYSGGFNSEFVQ